MPTSKRSTGHSSKSGSRSRSTSATKSGSSKSRSTSSRSRSSHSKTGSSTSKSSSSGRKYSPKAGEHVKEEIHEMKQGKLKSGRSGKTVRSRKQAVAIGLSKARKAGAKVPKKAA